MASLRADVKTMRDIPAEPQTSTIAQYVDSLPEERSFMDKLKGNSSLNVGDPKDHPLIGNFMDAIRAGQLDESRIQKLMKRNPMAASVFASAFDEYKKASTQQSKEKEIITRNFGMGDYLPPDQAGPVRDNVPRANFSGAANELIGAGFMDTAKKLTDMQKQMRENSVAGKGMYGGIRTGMIPGTNKFIEYGVDEQSGNAVEVGTGKVLVRGKDYEPTVSMTPQIIQGPDGQSIVTMPNRGSPGTSPSVTPTGLTPKLPAIPEKEVEFFNKSQKDLQSIDLLLKATDPNATAADKRKLAEEGIKWDPNAMGKKGLLPNLILQRVDPDGTSVRIAGADFQADKIHDRYAGNLTGQEIARSLQWGIDPTDTNENFRSKLTNQRRVLQSLMDKKSKSYTKQAGYAPNPALTAPKSRKPLGDIFK